MRTSRGRLAALAGIAALGLLLAGCAGVGKPDGWASPESAGQSLYVTLDRGHMTSLDAETYGLQWDFPSSDTFACGPGKAVKRDLEGIYEAPAIDSDTLYFGAYDKAVYAVNRADGSCKWRFETGDPIVGGVVLGSDGLYVPSEDGSLYLLNPEDGTEITSNPVGDIWATPLVLKDAVYVATMDGELWKLKPGTLEPLWDAPFSVSAALFSPPTMLGTDTILVGGIGKKLYAVNASDGTQKWAASGSNWFWGRPAVDGTRVYATNLGGEVKAIDGENGAELWTFKADASLRAGPVVAGDVVVAVDNDGKVYRLSEAAGELLGQPNELEEGVYATPVLLEARGGSATPSGTPAATAQPSSEVVLIATRSGHLWELDVAQGRTTEVVG